MTMAFVLFVINLLTFAIMGADKAAAKAGTHRVPEKHLFLCALAGGGLGGTIGMFYFHHKTKHKQFLIGFPIIAGIQCVFLLIFLQ